MNKKTILLAICILTILTLVGCSKDAPDSSTDVSTDTSVDIADPNPVVESEPATAPVHPPIIVEPSAPVEVPTVLEPIEPKVVTPLPLTVDEELLLSINNDAVPWGPGLQRDEEGRSLACVALQAKYGSYNANFIGSDDNIITLTFDQGYENGFAPAILDVLKEKNVQAIFFITGGYLNTRPDLIQRMIDEGHIIGSHSDKHLNFTDASIEDGVADLKILHEAVREQFDYEMQLFRYPGGAFSERALALVDQMGYKSVFWSFGYKDWIPTEQMSEEDAMAKVVEFLHPGEIALLHTVGETNSLILGDLIDTIRAEGYEVRPPSDIFDEIN